MWADFLEKLSAMIMWIQMTEQKQKTILKGKKKAGNKIIYHLKELVLHWDVKLF